MAVPKFGTKELTKHLRLLAMEAEGLSPSGDAETKAQTLARLLWKRALGYSEVRQTQEGAKEVTCPPESWAMQFIWERLEGKIGNAAPEESGKLTASERISDLQRNRINALSSAGATTTTAKPLPPKLPKKGE